MEGFPVFGADGLDDAQQQLWDELTQGPRGFYTGGADAQRLPDLYNAWLQFPEFGMLMLQLGDSLRGAEAFPGKLREIVVLTTSAMLGARVEFDFHVPFALNEGLTQDQIEALGEGRDPQFSDAAEQATFNANVQMLRTATLDPETRAAFIEAIGYPGLMQCIATVMLYTVTAWTTNIARVRLADDFSADPDRLKDFFAGKPVANGDDIA